MGNTLSDKDAYLELRRAAMNLLARREHAYLELLQKLLRRTDNKTLCEQVIDTLAEENLQSDSRFAENYIRHRSGRGYGPERIRMELGQKGVDDALIERSLSAADIDWLSILQYQYEKKYQGIPPEDAAQRAKYQRFFLYRGYSHQQIKDLF